MKRTPAWLGIITGPAPRLSPVTRACAESYLGLRRELLGLAQIDVAVERRELNFGSAAVNESVHSAIKLHSIFSLPGAVLLNHGLAGRRVHGDFEVAIHRAIVGLQFHSG